MTSIKHAMLLAAGLGTRMRPLTESVPKPLLRLGGRPLIDYALDRLTEAGVAKIIVNTHWHSAQIHTHLRARPQRPEIITRNEPELLDTAGGVIAALADGSLAPDGGPFFIVNSDSVWLDGPIPTLKRLQNALLPGFDAVMLIHRTFQIQANVGLGDFFLDSWGTPRRRREREVAPYIYAGITLAHPRLFQGLAAVPHSMNQVWDRALAAGTLGAVVHDGLWFHLTRPGDFEEAEHALAAQLTGSTT